MILIHAGVFLKRIVWFWLMRKINTGDKDEVNYVFSKRYSYHLHQNLQSLAVTILTKYGNILNNIYYKF